MSKTKFSEFTLQTIAQIVASPQSDFMYLAGHNEFSDENIKVPINDIIGLVADGLGAIVEIGVITDSDTYLITTDPSEYDGYLSEKVFVFMNGQEGYTSVSAVVDLDQATITFPYQLIGSYDLRIVMFK